MWFYGDVLRNITLYRMLRHNGVKHLKGGKQKLLNIEYTMKHIVRTANTVTIHNWWLGFVFHGVSLFCTMV